MCHFERRLSRKENFGNYHSSFILDKFDNAAALNFPLFSCQTLRLINLSNTFLNLELFDLNVKMTLISRFKYAFTGLLTWLSMSPVAEINFNPSQHPLGALVTHTHESDGDYPVFRPPAANPNDHDFECDYSAMEGWFPCSIAENRECWLRNKDGREFNIHTNYEKLAPVGISRNYTLNITEGSINADGQPFAKAKLFNQTYPGPWLEACWGDVSVMPGSRAICVSNLLVHRP